MQVCVQVLCVWCVGESVMYIWCVHVDVYKDVICMSSLLRTHSLDQCIT